MATPQEKAAAAKAADELTALDPYALNIPFFPITTVDTLRFLMELEHRAAESVKAKVQTFLEPGMRLTGLDGKPIAEVGARLHQKVTELLKDLLLKPTLAEEWSDDPTVRVGRMSGTSYQIAFMVYQEFGRLLAGSTREFVNVTDAIIIQGLNALHHGQDPLDSYKKAFQVKAQDEQGNPILGQEEAFHARLSLAKDNLYRFLDAKGLLTPAATPQDLPGMTEESVRLLNHLSSVLGSVQSMRIQGPDLMRGVAEAQAVGEQVSTEKMDSILKNAKNPHEA